MKNRRGKIKTGEMIRAAEEFAKRQMENYDSGHDWWHIERVNGLAKRINSAERSVDPFVLEIAVLLHDSADSKFAGGDRESGYTAIATFMDETGMGEIRDRVMSAIRNISFSNKNPSGDLSDPLLLVLQDADRLDAIGAIGVARAFNYGGFRNNSIYTTEKKQTNSTTIGHFYEKLLLLKGKMNTEAGKKLAEERHEFLEVFLRQFFKEWDFAISDVKV